MMVVNIPNRPGLEPVLEASYGNPNDKGLDTLAKIILAAGSEEGDRNSRLSKNKVTNKRELLPERISDLEALPVPKKTYRFVIIEYPNTNELLNARLIIGDNYGNEIKDVCSEALPNEEETAFATAYAKKLLSQKEWTYGRLILNVTNQQRKNSAIKEDNSSSQSELHKRRKKN